VAPHPVIAAARRHRHRRTGDLGEDICLFVLVLREVGVPASVPALLLAIRAVAMVDLTRPDDVQAVLRACLTSGPEQGAAHDAAFPVFWAAEAAGVLPLVTDPEAGGDDDAAGAGGDEGMPGTDLASTGEGAPVGPMRRAVYSGSGRDEAMHPVPFRERRQVEALARRLASALGTSRGVRTRTADQGDLIDLRDSLRHNLRYGEEMMVLRRSRPVPERSRLAVFCDVSSSMQPFTPLFLSFVHALTKSARSVESAIFNVDTAFVADVFRRRSLPEALAWLADRSISLAGGTRTGHCLHAFNESLEARGAFRSGTIALVLSDGWDVGDPELLDTELRRLRSQVSRLIWLDPHAASTDYQPQVMGLQKAWPYIDDYLDFSSLESLRDLVERVESRPEVRTPVRDRRHVLDTAYNPEYNFPQ
jgi:uncharacterized protein with von Willebrand factor type A (vWA) domain